MRSKTRELLIKTRRRLFGPNIGNNISAFKGNGIDFAELREYSYGDDVRKINWNATAREQKPYINVFNEERELNVVIAFMVSGSIYFGSIRQKQEVMAEILALLAFAAVKNSDRVSSHFFAEEEMIYFKPSKSQKSVYAMIEEALEIEALNRKLNLQAMADYLLKSVKERSVVILLGDFLQMADLSFLAAKHELYAVLVRDRFEENPKLLGECALIDPNSGKESIFEIDKNSISRYEELLNTHDKKLFEHFRDCKIGYTKIYTDEDPFYKLRELLR